LVAEGRLRPKLRPRHFHVHGHAHDPRIAGWTARWVVAPDPAEAGELARIAGRLGPPEAALPLGRLSAEAQLAPLPHATPRLLGRSLAPAAQLARLLAGGKDAPRTLTALAG